MISCSCGRGMEGLNWAGISPVRLVCPCGVVRVYEWDDRGVIQAMTTRFHRAVERRLPHVAKRRLRLVPRRRMTA